MYLLLWYVLFRKSIHYSSYLMRPYMYIHDLQRVGNNKN